MDCDEDCQGLDRRIAKCTTDRVDKVAKIFQEDVILMMI